MALYLETNAVRKLKDYDCTEHVYTSIFTLFELISGINKKEFSIRKSCIERIFEQKIEINMKMLVV